MPALSLVIPAQAGTQSIAEFVVNVHWVPACAGMTLESQQSIQSVLAPLGRREVASPDSLIILRTASAISLSETIGHRELYFGGGTFPELSIFAFREEVEQQILILKADHVRCPSLSFEILSHCGTIYVDCFQSKTKQRPQSFRLRPLWSCRMWI